MAFALGGDMRLMVSAMGARREYGLKAHQGNMRGDEKDSRGEGYADRGFEVVLPTAQHPGDDRTHQKAGGSPKQRASGVPQTMAQ